MRTITLLVIHCSAVRPDQNSSAAQIDTWHRQRGFHLGIGYHYVVRRNGQIEPGRPEFPEQKAALRWLLRQLRRAYPRALIVGHHDLNPQKACPCIENVAREYADLQPK